MTSCGIKVSVSNERSIGQTIAMNHIHCPTFGKMKRLPDRIKHGNVAFQISIDRNSAKNKEIGNGTKPLTGVEEYSVCSICRMDYSGICIIQIV